MFDTEKDEARKTNSELPNTSLFPNNSVVLDRRSNTVYAVGYGTETLKYDIAEEEWTTISMDEVTKE